MRPQDPRWFLPPPEYQIAVLPGIGGTAKPACAGAAWTAAPLEPRPRLPSRRGNSDVS